MPTRRYDVGEGLADVRRRSGRAPCSVSEVGADAGSAAPIRGDAKQETKSGGEREQNQSGTM